MLKSNIDVFSVTSFLCSLQFVLFHRIEYPKRFYDKKNLWLSFCDMTVPSKTNVPKRFYEKKIPVTLTLTFDL